jgi:hypothetical protein
MVICPPRSDRTVLDRGLVPTLTSALDVASLVDVVVAMMNSRYRNTESGFLQLCNTGFTRG